MKLFKKDYFDVSAEIRFDIQSNRNYMYNRDRWCLALIDGGYEIAKYYRKLTEKSLGIRLNTTENKFHLTLISGEDVKESVWNKGVDEFQYQKINFQLSVRAGTDGYYWWLPSAGNEIIEFRKEFELFEKPYWDYHATYGYLHPYWKGQEEILKYYSQKK